MGSTWAVRQSKLPPWLTVLAPTCDDPLRAPWMPAPKDLERQAVGGPLRIEVAGETNVGMKRTHNEDNFSIIEESGLYIVADGMGGHASGEIASKMAVDALREFFAATSTDPERTWPYKMDRSKGYEENRLITGIKLANLRIYESAQRDARQRGMGTTIAALFAVEDGVYLAHVGDSRVYRMRDGGLEKLTEDHSLLNEYITFKRLSPDEIANFPTRTLSCGRSA